MPGINDRQTICCGCCYSSSIELPEGLSSLSLEGMVIRCPECRADGKLLLADDEGFQWLEHHPLPRAFQVVIGSDGQVEHYPEPAFEEPDWIH